MNPLNLFSKERILISWLISGEPTWPAGFVMGYGKSVGFESSLPSVGDSPAVESIIDVHETRSGYRGLICQLLCMSCRVNVFFFFRSFYGKTIQYISYIQGWWTCDGELISWVVPWRFPLGAILHAANGTRVCTEGPVMLAYAEWMSIFRLMACLLDLLLDKRGSLNEVGQSTPSVTIIYGSGELCQVHLGLSWLLSDSCLFPYQVPLIFHINHSQLYN